MSTLLLATLFIVGVLALWRLLRQRAKPRFESRTPLLQKPSAEAHQEELPTDINRSLALTTAQSYDPASPEGRARPGSHMTSSKANSQASEAIVGEPTEASREAEELQVKSVFPQATNISDNEVEFGPPEAYRSDGPTADARIPISIAEIASPAIEPTEESATVNVEPTYMDIHASEGFVASTASAPSSGEAESGTSETSEPAPTETGPTANPPTYQPLSPPGQAQKTSGARERTSRFTPRVDTDLRLRLQLIFDRSGFVKTLALVADRREGMPENVEVTGTQGELRLTELRDDCYEAVPLVDAGNALLRGTVWRGCGDAQGCRWVLGGRELYVLASGDVCGLYPFGSSARLMLNARHVVLATVRLREEVLTALDETGSVAPEVSDDTTQGVPSGWLLFREVIPTRAVPMRDGQDILNALCPAHEIEPHFVGGIRLERNSYLAGYPPRIRLTGELGSDFQVLIDDQPVQLARDGALEAPGWDAEGEHRLWFGDRVETYSLRTMQEGWDSWHAHDFVIEATICGAGIYLTDSAHWRQVRVPATNPLLIGARPGEIFCCRAHHYVRSETILALVPFSPVWALPIDPVHADKRSARLVLLDSVPPIPFHDQANRNRNTTRALRGWIAAINDAGRKQLALAGESEDGKTLWRRYRTLAKQLWRRMR